MLLHDIDTQMLVYKSASYMSMQANKLCYQYKKRVAMFAPPPLLRGGEAWFVFEAISFELEVKETPKGLNRCIWERSRGMTSWIRFGSFSLNCLLLNVEKCVKVSRLPKWSSTWEEDGRCYNHT